MARKKALVFGGSRFFGRHLVKALIEANIDVTIVNRQQTKDPFANKVTRIKADRRSKADLSQLASQDWDVVYDQICFSSDDANDCISVLQGRVGRYVLTSTQSVYDLGANIGESAFDPTAYALKKGRYPEDFSYQEGKRQAESAFAQNADFPVAMVRVPLVVGPNDYTERLKWHVDRVFHFEEIYFSAPESRASFIEEKDAGQFIAWLGGKDYSGPINACSQDPIILLNLMGMIEKELKKTWRRADKPDDKNSSPYGADGDYYMDTIKAESLGYRFRKVSQYLPEIVAHYAKKL